MQKYQNNVTDRNGGAVVGVEVTVTTIGGAMATIYADNAGTPKANPLTTDANGYIEFYAPDGRYDIDVATAGGYTDVLLVDGVALGESVLTKAEAAAADGAAQIGSIASGTGAQPWNVAERMNSGRISILSFVPASERVAIIGGTSSYDCSAAILAATAQAAITKQVVDGAGLIYLHNLGTNEINANDVSIEFATFKRTSAVTGWMFRTATTANISGGGFRYVTLIGNPLVAASGGVMLGSATFKHSRHKTQHLTTDGLGQYGVGIEGGDEWDVSDISILNHGLTSGTISSCIGFYVFPKMASWGGKLARVRSEISAASQANASANHAAIKLQAHQRLTAFDITGIGGREECISIDSINGEVRRVFVKPQTGRPGLALGNYNTAHSFSGQTFVIDGVEVDGENLNYDVVIAAGTDGQYMLTGCTLRNFKGKTAGYLGLSNMRNCILENWDFLDLRLDSVQRGFTANSLPTIGCTYRNVVARGGGGVTGINSIEATDSTFISCGAIAPSGSTVGSLTIRGSGNTCQKSLHNNVLGNAISVIGNNNVVDDPRITGTLSGRSIWFQSGTSGNVVSGSTDLFKGTGVLDNGTGNTYRLPAQISADQGDANSTLGATSGIASLIYATPLTANRSVTLGLSGFPAGTTRRVIRQASATGAFNLNVGTGPLKALTSAGTWCDVQFDGTAWALTASGAL